jgi:hypothetical protein
MQRLFTSMACYGRYISREAAKWNADALLSIPKSELMGNEIVTETQILVLYVPERGSELPLNFH